MKLTGITKNIVLLAAVLTFLCCAAFTGCGEKGSDAAAAGYEAPDIYLDDDTYTIVGDKVLIPAGRPRVPQIMTDDPGVRIYQAYFPDGTVQAEAKVVCEEAGYVRTIIFEKDPSLGCEYQFGDYIMFETSFLPGTQVSYSSTDPKTVAVYENGEVRMADISDESVTITATDGVKTEELVISRVVPAVLDVYMLTGQSNAAYFHADPETAVPVKKGVGYIYCVALGDYAIDDITDSHGNARYGNIEPALAETLYEELGDKVLVINAGVNGMKIDGFLSGGEGNKFVRDCWDNAFITMNTEWFAARFEPRIMSYIWVQGESDDWMMPETYIEKYLDVHRLYLSDAFGLDYGFISNVASNYFRPNDAQERLAQAYDDIFMGSRSTFGFSVETGEMMPDDVHYSQKGDNIIGEDLGHTIALVYKGLASELPEGDHDI